jgi:hypothetical protein
MHVRSLTWSRAAGWSGALGADHASAQLVLSFGPIDAPDAAWFDTIAAHCPNAQHVYASGGGQIANDTVRDDDTVVTFLTFDTATVHVIALDGVTIDASRDVGDAAGLRLAEVPGLRHVLLFTEGLDFNATAFLAGLTAHIPPEVRVSGGLASNGIALSRTGVGLNGPPAAARIVAVGLAGDSLDIGTGSVGGWDFFGPERIVTSSNIAELYELDGERALDVYKRYLGTFAAELPGSALLFPLAVRATRDGPIAVRTILSIDEDSGTLRFAGDIPQGSTVRLMRTTTDKLIDGATQAATLARSELSQATESFTLCISCIGRRAVMRSRVEEELEEVGRESGSQVVVGFYSNGEIAPPTDGREHARAVLHNQTMTVTTIAER